MTIEQTVEIPVNRRIFIDLPPGLPSGKAKVEVHVTPVTEGPPHEQIDRLLTMTRGIAVCESAPDEYGRERCVRVSLMDLYGSCEGEDTMDAYFERKRADKTLESKNLAPHFQETGV
ncbi:MAG: hypothetical protein LBK66_00940 [Spirochaetaceae bacterium]|jgi:hypothetical protein|nr:hypothetical protein [Spirochaetaceae bacterium]